MAGQSAEPIVQFLAERADLLRIARNRFLPPAVGDSAQQSDERGRRGGR